MKPTRQQLKNMVRWFDQSTVKDYQHRLNDAVNTEWLRSGINPLTKCAVDWEASLIEALETRIDSTLEQENE